MSIWIYILVTYWALAITEPWKPKLAVMAVCKSFSFAQGILPFLGASQFWAKMDISARNNPLVNRVWRQLLGESSITSALGLVAEYDTTDNFFGPDAGFLLAASINSTATILGRLSL